MRGRPRAAARLLSVAIAACGNQVVVTAADVARGYVSALAEGGFRGACTMLAPEAWRHLQAAAGLPCATLLARCLPEATTNLSRDQSQLLYVNADPRIAGRQTRVRLSGLAVAREINEVTLIDARGRWLLTSPGENITRCARNLAYSHGRRVRA